MVKCASNMAMLTLEESGLTVVNYTPFQIVHCAVQHSAIVSQLRHDVMGLDITMCPPLCMQALHTLPAIRWCLSHHTSEGLCLSPP